MGRGTDALPYKVDGAVLVQMFSSQKHITGQHGKRKFVQLSLNTRNQVMRHQLK